VSRHWLAQRCMPCPKPAWPGFGLLPSEAERRARVIERYFRLLQDSVATYQGRQLLVRHTVAGVKVHDARLIASMKVHGSTHLLTFDAEDFTRYLNITVVTPQHATQTRIGSARLRKQDSLSGRSWLSTARLSPRGMVV